MSFSNRRITNHQQTYIRQSEILRKNLYEWDRMLHSPRGEDWPNMLGRLNVAFHQTGNLNKCIDDLMEHFVYQPRKSTTNPQDIPFFLSTRIVDEHVILDSGSSSSSTEEQSNNGVGNVGHSSMNDSKMNNPVAALREYESLLADIATEYEENMERF